MTSHYYDIVVVGMEIGPLTAGALLSKRGFRVLVVGQDVPRDHYRCFEYDFVRRPFVLPSAKSPIVSRVISELSASQLFQRSLIKPERSFQIVTKDARIDVETNLETTKKELVRETGVTAKQVDALFTHLGAIDGEIDKLLSSDLVIPAGSFFERRELARAEVQKPFQFEKDQKQFHELFENSKAARLLSAPARLATGDRQPVPLIPFARTLGGWLFGCRQFAEGLDGLRTLLSDRVVGHGGELHAKQGVAEVIVKSGRVEGVRLAGTDDIVACQAVLTDLTPDEISHLIQPTAWTKRFEEQVASSPRSVRGYAINLGVDSDVVPDWQAHTVFLVGEGEGPADLIRLEKVPQKDPRHTALHASCVVSQKEEHKINTGELRDSILDKLREFMPFLDHGLRVIHSPFDTFGALDFTGNAKGKTPPKPREEDVSKWFLRSPNPDDTLGIGNLPHRCGIKGLLLSGSQVVSGLGVEGEMLAGWGAARIAGKIDTRRERLVRSMRSKIEIS